MYSIQGLETVFDVMAYTASALKEVGYSDGEIEDYVSTALSEDYNIGVIEVSKEWLDECNKICADMKLDKEAYEGFSSCKSYYWDSSKANNEENDYLDGYTIKDYYDSMRSEYDVEPSYDPFSEDEED